MDRLDFVGSPDEQACLANILSAYPWEEYNFKFRAWVRTPRRWKSIRTGEKYKWTVSVDTPVQLISRETGEPVGEVTAYLKRSAFGIMRFAGDPALIGACLDVSDPKRRVWFTHSTSISHSDALRLGRSIRPGGTPLTRDVPNVAVPQLSEIMWVADQPAEAPRNMYALNRAERQLRKLARHGQAQ